MTYHAGLFNLISSNHWLVAFGWMGVDLFFVLSGFLIAGQLLRPYAKGMKPDFSRFLSRRLLRTLPAYLAVVGIYFLFPWLRDQADIQPLWQFLTLTQNLFIDSPPPKAFSQAWSLCVEEQFYLLFPLLVAVLARRPNARVIAMIFFSVVTLGIGLRGILWIAAEKDFFHLYLRTIYYPTWTRLDDLVAGVGSATLQTFRPRLWSRLAAKANLLLISGLLGVGACLPLFGYYLDETPLLVMFGYPILAISMASLVIAGASERCLIGRRQIPGATLFATGAYSLYLTHKLVFHAVQASGMHRQSIALLVATSGAIVAATALYWTIERPFLRLRDKLDGPTRSPLVKADAST